MSSPLNQFWRVRLESVATALQQNHFCTTIVDSIEDAKALLLDTILPQSGASTVSFGGSTSVVECGVVDALRLSPEYALIDTLDRNIAPADMIERRRQALLSDVFITGCNAVTECGKLVNLDMIGNRVGAITFGPKKVVLIVGRNKIVSTVEEGQQRIKQYAAPVNAMRLQKKTPCAKTGQCMDCKSPDRICNTWVITEKCFPVERIHIVLVNKDLGF